MHRPYESGNGAGVLFLFALVWLFVLGLANRIPLLALLVFAATQTAWIIGAALLADGDRRAPRRSPMRWGN